MSDFLRGFSRALVYRLQRAERIELVDGSTERVILHLTHHLGTLPEGRSLLSSVEQGLLACGDVIELYFDLEELKDIVEDLR